jgi:hypothetical protein
MIDQDVQEYVEMKPPIGKQVQALKAALDHTAAQHYVKTMDADHLRIIVQAARNWLLVERMPELLQLPGEPSLANVRLNLGAGGHFSVDGWIDEESFVEISGSKLNPADALKDAFAKT